MVFSDNWKINTLEEIADVLDGERGKNYPNGNNFIDKGHILFLSASNVTKDDFRFDNNQYIS
jgi:type I restriction enzyme S subunit